MQIVRWTCQLLSQTAWLDLQGEIPRTVGDAVRSYAAAIVRSVPADMMAEVDRRTRVDRDTQKADVVGPPLEKVDGRTSPALRRDPRG